MKKFMTAILSVLIASGVCFGAVGCGEKDPINYTAVEPFIKYELKSDENNILQYKNYDLLNKLNEFDEFSKYYKDNFVGNNLYILDYGLELPPWAVSNDNGYWRTYCLFKKIDKSELLICEEFYLYDRGLGVRNSTNKATGVYISMVLSIFIKPLSVYTDSEFVLEFGKSKEKVYGDNKFINIYSCGECFATCYFDSGKVKVTEEWFENYFTQNLIWVDSL